MASSEWNTQSEPSLTFSKPRSKSMSQQEVNDSLQDVDEVVDYIADKIIIPIIEPFFRLSLIWDYMFLALMFLEQAVAIVEQSVENLSIDPRQLRKVILGACAIVVICNWLE